jgi:hypothetical protein
LAEHPGEEEATTLGKAGLDLVAFVPVLASLLTLLKKFEAVLLGFRVGRTGADRAVSACVL